MNNENEYIDLTVKEESEDNFGFKFDMSMMPTLELDF